MWRTTGRAFLQRLQPLHRAPPIGSSRRHILQDVWAAGRVLLGVPVLVAGAGLVLAGSQLVATTAMRRRHRRRHLKEAPAGGKEAEGVGSSSQCYSELELLLRQQYLDNASCVVQGQRFMTAADFVAFVRGGNGGQTGDINITGGQAIQPQSCNMPNTGVQVGQSDREGVHQHTSRIPHKWQTSAHFFRDLGEDGLLDLADFVLLLHIITTSPEFFKPIFKVLTNGGASLLTADDFHYMKLALSPKQPIKVTKGKRQWSILQVPWKASPGMISAFCQGSIIRMGLTTTRSGPSDDGGSVLPRMFTKGSGEADRTVGHVSCISTHLFGARGQVGGIRFWDLKRFILNVHREVLEVEFAELAGDKGYLTLHELNDWTFRFAAQDREDKMADVSARIHGNNDVRVTIDDLQSLHDVIRYHLKDITDAMTLYMVLSPSGLTSPRDVQEMVQLGSGMRLEAGLCEAVFRLFSAGGGEQGGGFDVDLFSDVMQRRKSFGLPLKVTEVTVMTLEDDGELEEEEL